MDTSSPLAPAQPKKSLFGSLLLVGIPCAIGFTIVLSYIVLHYTYGGPGLGFVIAPFAYLIMSGLGNIILAAILAFALGHKLQRQSAITILVLLNIITLVIFGGVVITDYLKKSAAGQKVEQKNTREQYVADHATDIAQCDEISDNFYYWQRCLDTTRSQETQTRSLSERLTICLQQAQQKHFSYQPEPPTKTCQDRFGTNP